MAMSRPHSSPLEIALVLELLRRPELLPQLHQLHLPTEAQMDFTMIDLEEDLMTVTQYCLSFAICSFSGHQFQ